MKTAIYHTFTAFVHPFALLVLGLVAVIIVLWRRAATPRRPLIAATVLVGMLAVLSCPAVGYVAMLSLECAYPPEMAPTDRGQAIVVLSCGMRLYDATGKHVEPGYETAARCLHAADVYHRGPRRPVLVSGGKDPSDSGPTLAEVMRDLLVKLRVDPADIIVEPDATTTFENATLSEKLLRRRGIHRIVLVTDAAHMRRSVACFDTVGLEVTAAPCNYSAGRFKWSLGMLLPSSAALDNIDYFVHEWIGVAWYRLHGRL